MADVIFVTVATAFFGLCVAYVRALDRMLGPGAPLGGPLGPGTDPEGQARAPR